MKCGWLSRQMGGYVGRWVAKSGRLVANRKMGGSSLGSNPDISQKYKVGDKSEGVANTL